jgi:hypothetical protein
MRYRIHYLTAFCLILGFRGIGQLAAQERAALSELAHCAQLDNPLVPSACLSQIQHGTLVKKAADNVNIERVRRGSLGVLTFPGVDLGAACGSPIYSIADGIVADVISNSADPDFADLGYMVRIKHPSTSTGLPLPATQLQPAETVYLYMKDPPSVHAGDVVLEHERLGSVGNTGGARACETHFEIRHFPGRYLNDPAWSPAPSLYGKGDQTGTKLFNENWTNPLPWLSKLPEQWHPREPIEFDLSVKGTVRPSPPPPASYVDAGACPGEGCKYNDVWTMEEPTPVHPARGSAQTAFVLAKGQKVTTVSGVVITKPGRIQILHPISIPEIGVIDSGEIEVLTYRGEGFWKAWINGKLIDAVQITNILTSMTCDLSEAPCKDKLEAKWIAGPIAGKMLELPKPAWWVQIKDRTGRTGWIEQSGPTWSGVNGDF